MNSFFRGALLASAMLLPSAAWAHGPDGEDDQDKARDEIVVTGTIEQKTPSATGLSLTPKETPQSITIIDRTRIDDFALNNVNDLLTQTVGINVERVETDRTYFNARGFDITNFQFDGIGMPLVAGIQFGDLDTALFDRVEAIRGANAIMTGIGNPSATINYVRKRPLDALKASASIRYGSWNSWRAEGDVSVPLNDSVGVRLVYAHQEGDNYLAYNRVNRDVFGATIEAKILDGLTFTAGYSRQDNDASGVMWGSLPLSYTDGTRIPYARSASTAADWTYWNTLDQTAFAELAYDIGGGWSAKTIATYRRLSYEAKLLYAYGNPDKATGLGLGGMAGIYPSVYDQYLGDFYVSGPVKLFGREHQLAFGVSSGRTDVHEWENFSLDAIDYPPVLSLGQVDIAEPSYPGEYLAADYSDRLKRAYGAAHLNLSDRLKAVVGVSAMWLESLGDSYGTDQSRKNSKISPYVGALFDLTPNLSLYASYTDIFNPQSEILISGQRLDPAAGSSLEGGIKSEWFGGKLYATASLFRAKQKGLAAFAGTCAATDPCRAGDSYYTGVDTTSKGFEIELAGKVTDNWSISGGYTGLKIEDEAGNPARTFLPRRTLKLATTYTVPQLNDLKLGAQFRWQGDITYADSGVQAYGIVTGDVILRQPSYAVVDLMASVRLVDKVRASVNVRNVGNEKYLGSLMWGQAYYAAPRNVSVALSFNY
ncbi:outer membrane receptor for ferric coprogen and ferric-rhodotorulic acid [Sphingomonas kyeonggiensis]|uniref:Outer membrane receptor for ferric coprogen and ferric-rhodotorulic acid n=1 Tax=Sphingomonas kyeonggiensis TaxID=1268553 RepID=A0A7W7K4Z3_9SPHN|nr:TonB-dependent siderophore receptor [Sphingomonas kyeonggiensis]MBB4841149.1 outer membrane receptor for ferric coprogen and ferric-rhodotorulic acid [Sphingomonas kyeonggiensis]